MLAVRACAAGPQQNIPQRNKRGRQWRKCQPPIRPLSVIIRCESGRSKAYFVFLIE
jgi:hypothetical protein